MKTLKGRQINQLPVDGLFKVGDLVNYEGPLMSLFSNQKGELYLYHWCDCDESHHRWLVYPVTLNQLINYLNRKLTHYQLIMGNRVAYAVDLDGDAEVHNLTRLPTAEIPEDYLPDKEILHDDEDCPHLDQITDYLKDLASKTSKTVSFKTSVPTLEIYETNRLPA
jgi:hypothetical protein